MRAESPGVTHFPAKDLRGKDVTGNVVCIYSAGKIDEVTFFIAPGLGIRGIQVCHAMRASGRGDLELARWHPLHSGSCHGRSPRVGHRSLKE